MTDVVEIDGDTLSDTHREILSTAISEEYGYSTCVDDAVPAELSDIVHDVFEVDESLKHFSSERVTVAYEGRRYHANYGVAVV